MKDVVAFECRMCGHCCQGEGGIILTDKDRKRLAAHLKLSVEEMIARYTAVQNGKIGVACGEGGYCVFFVEGKGCSVHPGRPDVCRAWPFFRGNLIDKDSWEMIQEYCPGVNPEAGHAEFARQGRAYLLEHGLARDKNPDNPNALIIDREHRKDNG